jgi:hypothetical protein
LAARDRGADRRGSSAAPGGLGGGAAEAAAQAQLR